MYYKTLRGKLYSFLVVDDPFYCLGSGIERAINTLISWMVDKGWFGPEVWNEPSDYRYL